MTREEKALAAFGSVIAVAVLFALVWSVPLALFVLVVGLATTVAVLRATHPHGHHRPTLRTSGPAPLPPPPLSDEERAAQQAELERRRREAERRAAARIAEPERPAAARATARGRRDEEAR